MTAVPLGSAGPAHASTTRSVRRRVPRAHRVVKAAADGARLPEQVVVASTGLVVVSLLAAWVLLQIFVLGSLEQDRAQDRLYAQIRADLAEGTAPTGGVIAPGRPVSVMAIPDLGIKQVIVEGTASGHLMKAPGHRRDTVLPGQAGVSVVYGKSKTFGGSFGSLAEEGRGTSLTVVTGQGRATYRIQQVRRAGDPVPAPPAAGAGRMTLVTSSGSGALSALRPSETIFIDASLETTPFPAGGARVNTISDLERPMAGDTSVLPILALAIGGLLVVVVGACVAFRRFDPVVSWTVTAPVLIALLWFTGDLVVHLVPNVV